MYSLIDPAYSTEVHRDLSLRFFSFLSAVSDTGEDSRPVFRLEPQTLLDAMQEALRDPEVSRAIKKRFSFLRDGSTLAAVQSMIQHASNSFLIRPNGSENHYEGLMPYAARLAVWKYRRVGNIRGHTFERFVRKVKANL